MTDKNTLLTYDDTQLYVIEEVNIQDRIFLLVAEVDQTEEDISDNIFIVEKTITEDNRIMIRQVMDKPTLAILNPAFEDLIEINVRG